MGLEIEADDSGGVLLVHPLGRLQYHGAASTLIARIVAEIFECRLLPDVRRGAVGVALARWNTSRMRCGGSGLVREN